MSNINKAVKKDAVNAANKSGPWFNSNSVCSHIGTFCLISSSPMKARKKKSGIRTMITGKDLNAVRTTGLGQFFAIFKPAMSNTYVKPHDNQNQLQIII